MCTCSSGTFLYVENNTQAMDYRLLHILALTLIKMVSAHPTGAPTTACSTFRPNHGVNLPQSSVSPYLLDLSEFAVASSFVYNPGQQYSSESIV